MKVFFFPLWVKCSPSHKSVGLTELGAFVLLLKEFPCLLALGFTPALLRVGWGRWGFGGGGTAALATGREPLGPTLPSQDRQSHVARSHRAGMPSRPPITKLEKGLPLNTRTKLVMP